MVNLISLPAISQVLVSSQAQDWAPYLYSSQCLVDAGSCLQESGLEQFALERGNGPW